MTTDRDPADDDARRLRLAAMRRKLDILTSKPARAEAMREIARLQWQLGEITDDELRRIEEFADRFSYE
jgi:hypothetical protein